MDKEDLIEFAEELRCPKCGPLHVDDPTVRVSFSPMGSRLEPDGALDWGDCFADYVHLECGTSTRLVIHKTWDDKTFEYVLTTGIDIEAYDADQKLILLDGPHEPADPIQERFFSGNVANDLPAWVPTVATLLVKLNAALDKLHLVDKGVAG